MVKDFLPGRYRLFSVERGTKFFECDFASREMLEKYAIKRGFKSYIIEDILNEDLPSC